MRKFFWVVVYCVEDPRFAERASGVPGIPKLVNVEVCKRFDDGGCAAGYVESMASRFPPGEVGRRVSVCDVPCATRGLLLSWLADDLAEQFECDVVLVDRAGGRPMAGSLN